MSAARSAALRVGIFLTAGLLVAAFIIFAIGEKRGLFERKVTLYAHFGNTGGLVSGAPVRLAGLDVGTVSAIEFPDELGRKEARVSLSIGARYLGRVRHDSEAFIDSKGLLGDKIIGISLGSPGAAPHQNGDTLRTRGGPSMEDLANKLEEAISSVASVSRSADSAIQGLTTEDVRTDVARIAKATADLLEQIQNGDGMAHRVLYDSKWADQVGATLVRVHGAVTNVESATARVDRILAQVESGNGSAHAFVYGTSAKEAVDNLRDATATLASVLGEVRDGNGLLHSVIYDEEQTRAVHELTEMAVRMNRVAGDIEKGRGTIGGLLVDPTVYEDLKTILGNVERNVLLKALIRFTIKEGDIERPAKSAYTVEGEGPRTPAPPPAAQNRMPSRTGRE
jgi:phospholipid/cholesterol/gamma-HCH transport system substrate-binding protein